jgi:phosphoribosylformylglycinamidine synthase
MFPGDRPITPELVREHKLTEAEYERVTKHLGRVPTYSELGVFSVMWSEHCSYKSSRVHLKKLPTEGPRVIQGPGENAGVVDIGDGFAAVFKIESHNHPSFIEPYQGAATGVGGILRDVFTMGARPIAGLNSLRFGRPDHPRTRELVHGVVAGIGGYGNSIGVPTVGGEVQFDTRYDGNILVNAFTCGVVRTDRIFYGRAEGVGNPILYIGSKTGRDGIHGATMASDEFSSGENQQDGAQLATAASIKSGIRSTMQVGDPFLGKLLLEACLELFSADVLAGIQDMGAAGLTSSSVEMAGRSGSGVEIDLDCVPRRAKRMTPYEILLSESQERMLLVAKRGFESKVLEICAKWDLDAVVIGRVTDTGRWVVRATPGYDPLADDRPKTESVVVCDIPVGALTDDAPKYDRPRAPDANLEARSTIDWSKLPSKYDFGAELLELCKSANIGSRHAVWEQYDSIVRGGTIVRPGSDAAVVRVPCERDGKTIDKYLAFAVDCNGRMVELDPEVGGAMAVAEVCRNLVVSGAEPIGLSDCLNFGNPEQPTVMEQFARSVEGIAAACKALGVPIVSGNVSLYNDTDKRPILPTPTMAAVGLVAHLDDVVTAEFKRADQAIVLLGPEPTTKDAIGGSEWLAEKTGRGGVVSKTGAVQGDAKAPPGPAPKLDLALEAKLQRLVLDLARAHLLASAHDVADGGLAVALAECCTTGRSPSGDVGAKIDSPSSPSGLSDLELASWLFGETPSRVVCTIDPAQLDAVLARAKAAGVPARRLGTTGGGELVVASPLPGPEPALRLALPALRTAREACLTSIA